MSICSIINFSWSIGPYKKLNFLIKSDKHTTWNDKTRWNSIPNDCITDESFSEDSDDFLDEYGNIREESSDSSNVSEGEEKAVGIQRKERGPRGKKKKKNKKKKKDQSSANVSGASNQDTNQSR